MKKALIFTSFIDNLEKIRLDFNSYKSIICADGGYIAAQKLGIKPSVFIGDYDSGIQPADRTVIKLPTEKDMTDSEAAVDLAISKGYDEITVLGGLGGRFDHTMGNIGIIAKYADSPYKVTLVDGNNKVYMLCPGNHRIKKSNYKYLGLISYGCSCYGLNISGVKYPLLNCNLKNNTTLGVSNEILDSEARLSFKKGRLLIIESNDVKS